MKLSIIIPAYNEKENIKSAIEEVFSVCNGITDVYKLHVVVVDDHSSDNTFDIVSKMNDRRIVCLRLNKRVGSHFALRAGMKEAGGDVVLCISADGQDNPSCIGDMLSKWRAGADIIWALRKSRGDEPWYIRIPAQAFYRLLSWLTDMGHENFDLPRADFFLLDKKVVDAINSYPTGNTSLFGLILWLGFPQDFVEYERRPRRFGKSKWNLISRLNLAKDWIIPFSVLPLKLISVLGAIITIIVFIYGIYVIKNAITGTLLLGWSAILETIFILGGIQMIIIGIGAYLWHNLLDESWRRPPSFIKTKKRQ